jgi:uncharacterized protein
VDNHKASLRNTKKFGKAVFANQQIRKGEIIAEFDGEIYDDDFVGWTPDIINHAIQFAKDKWRDSRGIARYLNHSCEPNCGIRGSFKIVAMRAIKKGEQLTWDYEMTENSDWWQLKCKCGSPICRKRIGRYSQMPKSIRKKYAGYISHWLTKKKRRKK